MGKAGWFLIVLLISAASGFSAQPQLRIGKYAGRAQEKTSVRVASCSIVPRKWDKAANWEGIERMVRQAAGQLMDVYCRQAPP